MTRKVSWQHLLESFIFLYVKASIVSYYFVASPNLCDKYLKKNMSRKKIINNID